MTEQAEVLSAGDARARMMVAVDAAMVEMKNIHPALKRSECERLIGAAFAAAPAPVERCPNCLGRGEYAGVYGRHQCDRVAHADPSTDKDSLSVRQSIIDVLLSTSGQSEAVTADAIMSIMHAPVERVEQEALRKRFDEIEREICDGKHTAASVFTQMRTADFYTTPQPAAPAAHDVAGLFSTNGDENGWPRIGEKYLVIINGVLQKETFEFDQSDDGIGGGEYFWSRHDCDECPAFDPDRDEWLAIADLEAAHQSGGAKQ